MFSQSYIFDTTVSIAVLWLFYVAVLHRRINFTGARIYLLAMFPAGVLFAMLKLPILPAKEIPAVIPWDIPAGMVFEGEFTPASALSFSEVLRIVWVAGALVMALILITGVVRLFLRIRRSKATPIEGIPVIFDARVAGAYSAFGTIFLNDKYEGSPLLGQILSHEQSHITNRHSLDLVWMGLWRCLLWWHPVAWHTFKLLREVHEFQADQHVIREGNPIGEYINLLLDTEVGTYPGAANPLCYSLTKKRLKMMTNYLSKSKRWGMVRLLALIPVCGALLCAFSLTAKADEPPEQKLSGFIHTLNSKAANSDEKTTFILDGVRIPAEEVALIPSDELDHITVLKKSAATEKYGPDVDGVVEIFTKKAKNKPEFNMTVPIERDESEPTIAVQEILPHGVTVTAVGGKKATGSAAFNSENKVQVFRSPTNIAVTTPSSVSRAEIDGTKVIFMLDDQKTSAETIEALDPEIIESVRIMGGHTAKEKYPETNGESVVEITTRKK